MPIRIASLSHLINHILTSNNNNGNNKRLEFVCNVINENYSTLKLNFAPGANQCRNKSYSGKINEKKYVGSWIDVKTHVERNNERGYVYSAILLLTHRYTISCVLRNWQKQKLEKNNIIPIESVRFVHSWECSKTWPMGYVPSVIIKKKLNNRE